MDDESNLEVLWTQPEIRDYEPAFLICVAAGLITLEQWRDPSRPLRLIGTSHMNVPSDLPPPVRQVLGRLLLEVKPLKTRWLVRPGEPTVIWRTEDVKAWAEENGFLPRDGGNKRATTKARAASDSNPFHSVPDLQWESVIITVYADDAVKIKAGGKRERVTYAELGFKDGRTGNKPKKAWSVFQLLARYHGELDWDAVADLSEREKQQMKKHIQNIREYLKSYMGIDEDPFLPYKREGAYKAKFFLTHDV